MSGNPRVAIVYGSPSDHDIMAQAGAMLQRFGVAYDEQFISPHRSPRTLADYVAELEPSGVECVIAGASIGGGSLAGSIASFVTIPVIGVPLRGTSPTGGVDAILSLTEMSTGVPVAVVGLDNAKNAAVLAVQILSIGDPDLRAKLANFKDAFEAAAAGR
ncbi:MAG: 5-(carboxyamino)imidazole ribonucleotide mutase [Frankiaceae bacterium]|nr:5-(carboxyamino)imidazole ribonucleotide mutase [Frankiaceae bacterium]MDQ1714391.1 5-(carboxyamino)imidazole ribonucleotide mutase [Frankiaceae bacterium]